MEAVNLLSDLRKNGFSIKTENSRLFIAPANNLTNEIKQNIKKSKAEILCALHRETELIRLISLVAEYNNFDRENYEEAVKHAIADPINALTCFSSLARRAGLL